MDIQAHTQPAVEPAAARGAPRLLAVGTALPPHPLAQAEARALAGRWFAAAVDGGAGRRLEVFDHTEVESRRICMPPQWYETPHGFEETSRLFVEHGVTLAAQAATATLRAARWAPGDVDHVVLVSSTGIAAPSLDARLATRIGLRGDVRRTPVWGLGCAGGAAGLALAADLAAAGRGGRALLVCVELCSLTFQRRDLDPRNLVAAALFSDGAAAAALGGGIAGAGNGDRRPLEVVARRSTLWPGTTEVMGWTVDGHGLHVVFSRDIPGLVRERSRAAVTGFLRDNGLELGDVRHWAVHPGGPRVLTALSAALGVDAWRFEDASRVLRECGNMSSPTCLFVLERILARREVRAGDWALLLALGPGFAMEQVLLRAG